MLPDSREKTGRSSSQIHCDTHTQVHTACSLAVQEEGCTPWRVADGPGQQQQQRQRGEHSWQLQEAGQWPHTVRSPLLQSNHSQRQSLAHSETQEATR